MKKVLLVAVCLGGCATFDKGLDVVDGVFTAGSATVDIVRAAGKDVSALWSNIWSPVGLAGTPLTEPFKVEEPPK